MVVATGGERITCGQIDRGLVLDLRQGLLVVLLDEFAFGVNVFFGTVHLPESKV